jgi:hypothetical protein
MQFWEYNNTIFLGLYIFTWVVCSAQTGSGAHPASYPLVLSKGKAAEA